MSRLLMSRFPAFLLLLFFVAPALAHDTQLSSLKIIHSGERRVVVSVSTHAGKLAPANFDSANLDLAIRARLKLQLDGRFFDPPKALLIRDAANDMVTWQAPYRGAAGKIEVLSPLYPEDTSARLTVAVFDRGRIRNQAVLSAANPSCVFDTNPDDKSTGLTLQRRGTLQVTVAFFQQGVLHIFGGLDHICFVLGLLLLGGSLRVLLKTVTALTLAHSLTLTLATLQLWTPPTRIVELLIALSIVAVAIENLRVSRFESAPPESTPSCDGWRPVLAFGFGLIHGFGFASALNEIGLPRDALVPALAFFNLGVEIGQATIVLGVAPLLTLLAHKSKPAHYKFVIAGSCAIAVTGAFWFVQRVVSA